MIQGERSHGGMTLCSATRARHYLQHGCAGYVAYVMDTREKGKVIIHDVPIVREYPDVFSEDLSGVPPESQVEFKIDLVPGVAPITKAPYRLVLPRCRSCLHSYKIC